MKKLRWALTAILFLFSSSGAFATSTISCQNESGNIAIDMTIGFAAVQAIIQVGMSVDDKLYSTFQREVPKSIPISISQSFFETDAQDPFEIDRIMLDIANENHENIVARLRLVVATDEDGQVSAGILQINNLGIFPVICSGP
jgi:hypothetical protein